MPRAGASDEDVLAAAGRVLRERRTVRSQRLLGELVAAELRREHPEAAIAPARVRRLVAGAPFCRLDFRARRGPREKPLYSCPVCRGPVRRVKNLTLFGGEVTLVLRCTRCSYRTGKEKLIPTLYVFHHRAKEERDSR